ncbi:hypothetical protein KEM48_006942 [Puccinia striiformis f. sp. tritici PST-130]|nr:hypothetical protein KEM48_006942 [Puccinia striiformis f. sp. tritici PST-130]
MLYLYALKFIFIETKRIYLSLDQREVEREEKMKLHDDQHPYTAMVSQMPVNKLKNRLLLVNPIQGTIIINASWIYEPAFETPSALLNRLANHHLLLQLRRGLLPKDLCPKHATSS